LLLCLGKPTNILSKLTEYTGKSESIEWKWFKRAEVANVTSWGETPRMEEMMIAAKTFSALADNTARITGKPIVFIGVCMLTAVWLVAGPFFAWSDAWQLIANTVTSVVTFLMVFVIQDSQNRDSAAIQTKLDELIRVISPATDLIGIEDLTQDEIEMIKERRKDTRASSAH
jgi:low affinity Fe/Cu permease